MFKRLLAFCLLLTLVQPAAAAGKGDYVVLLHGIFRTASSMNDIAEAFGENGYRVINIDYPSTEHSIADIAQKIRPQIEKAAKDKSVKIHFVGHSMGGLVIRAYLAKYRPKNLGRVVMMGTPNGGSEVADFMKNTGGFKGIYESVYGPAGQQLSTDNDYDRLLGRVSYPVGVIAGNDSYDPVSSWIIPGDDDGKVSVEKTHVKGEADHIILPASHVFMPSYDIVAEQALAFVKNGKFSR